MAADTLPTAGGSLSFTAYTTYHSQYGDWTSFLLSATGLPSNAVLDLTVDGTAKQSVTTGPTGNLFLKGKDSVFPKPPKQGEVVNVLTDATDLFTAESFVFSDSQGNVLLRTVP